MHSHTEWPISLGNQRAWYVWVMDHDKNEESIHGTSAAAAGLSVFGSPSFLPRSLRCRQRILSHMPCHGVLDDVGLNFQGDDSSKLVRRKGAHGQPLRV